MVPVSSCVVRRPSQQHQSNVTLGAGEARLSYAACGRVSVTWPPRLGCMGHGHLPLIFMSRANPTANFMIRIQGF